MGKRIKLANEKKNTDHEIAGSRGILGSFYDELLKIEDMIPDKIKEDEYITGNQSIHSRKSKSAK